MAYNKIDPKLQPKDDAMRYSRAFSWCLIWRLLAILGIGAAILWALQQPHALATITMLVLLMCLLFADLLRLIQRTNIEVARLANALQYGDFSVTFKAAAPDASFPALGDALDNLMSSLRTQMTDLRADASHLASLVDHVPIPLLTIDSSDQVELLNNAARRLFSRPHGKRLADFAVYGATFVDDLRRSDSTQVVRLNPPDDAVLHMRLTQTQVTRMGRLQRLIALQPIQSDMDATEMALSRDLVRVLTHEIMNSLTPVISLAKSAAAMSETLADSADKNNDEVRDAIGIVARRTEGLMQFVGRYREITGSPVIKRETFLIAHLWRDLELLFRADWPAEKINLQIDAEPADSHMLADRQLLEHVLINCLRNAAQACVNDAAAPTVKLSIRPTHSGRHLIDIEDNGLGIPEAIRHDVFLPFFTTKTDGSGIGLSLARQVVLAHGGSIRVETSSLGGACLRLVL